MGLVVSRAKAEEAGHDVGDDSKNVFSEKNQQAEVESFRKCLPMLSFVRGDGWERTHWAQLFSLMAFPSKGADAVSLDNLNLGHFLNKADRLFAKADEVKALHAQAQGEVSRDCTRLWLSAKPFSSSKPGALTGSSCCCATSSETAPSTWH